MAIAARSWDIETLSQEMRSDLGLETTRRRSEKTILRLAPCLFGLYTLVALCYAALPQSHPAQHVITWAGKDDALNLLQTPSRGVGCGAAVNCLR